MLDRPQSNTGQHARRAARLLVIPAVFLLVADVAFAERDRRGRAAERVSAQEYRAGERRAKRASTPARPARNGRADARPETKAPRAERARSEQPRSQRKGESGMSRHARPERNAVDSARRNGTHKAAAVERYERRLNADGGKGKAHQTAAGRSAAGTGRAERSNARDARTATRATRADRPQADRRDGNRARPRTGRSSGDAMAYAPVPSTRTEHGKDRAERAPRGDRREGRGAQPYRLGYRNGVRDARRDHRRQQKRRHFLDHWRPYPGWVAPRRIYRDTVWVGFATHHHQAHRHGYLSGHWLFAGEFKTRTRHVSDPAIYVDERVDAIEIEGLKRDLHVRRAWMILGNGRAIRLHDLEGYLDAGYTRAVFLSRDRYVKRVELEVEPVGYSRGYARINVRRTESGHIHDDYCEH